MYVSEIKNNYSPNISFAAKSFGIIKHVRSKEAVVQLTGDIPSRVVAMVGSVEKLHRSLKKLEVQKANPQAQNCLEVLRTVHGYRGILETPADGVVLAGNEGKNWIVSSHGVNALRMREQNAQTGEIESSIFIHDKKVAKTDTKHEIPKNIEDLRHEDVGYQFGTEFQTKLDDADYALVRVRRALSAPEFQAEIAKVEPAQILPVNIKPKKAVEVVEKPEPAPPVSIEKSAPAPSAPVEKPEPLAPVEKPEVVSPKPVVRPVKRAMDEKRIALVNSLLSGSKKTPDAAVEVAEEVVVTAPVKRRGRPKGSVNKPKVAKPVQKQPATQTEMVEKQVTPTPPQKVKKPVQAVKKPVAPSNKLSDEEKSLIDEVKSEFKRVYATLSSKGLSKNTRSVVKNGYGEKLLKNKTSSRILNFVGIGQDGSNVGINVFEVKDGDFLHLRLTDKNNKVKNVIVDPQGRVTRRSIVANIKESEEKNSAYTRQELDELELVPVLKRLKGELGEYNTYVEARLEKAEKRKNIREEGIRRNAENPQTAPKRGRKPKKAEVNQNLNPQQLMKFIQEQVNQVRIELDKNLRLMMAEITTATSQSFRTFSETATNKLNELQANLAKLVDKG